MIITIYNNHYSWELRFVRYSIRENYDFWEYKWHGVNVFVAKPNSLEFKLYSSHHHVSFYGTGSGNMHECGLSKLQAKQASSKLASQFR